jgi:hypothetical protein
MKLKTRLILAASLAVVCWTIGIGFIYSGSPLAVEEYAMAATDPTLLYGTYALLALMLFATGSVFGWHWHRKYMSWVVRQDPTNWSNDPEYWSRRSAPD